jgi:hypothetical protein
MNSLLEKIYVDDLYPARKVLSSLQRLVEDGYRQHATEICNLLSELSSSHYPMRILTRIFCNTDDAAKLAGAQSYIIYGCTAYYLRINFWLPFAERHAFISDRFNRYFSIGVLHNHSFDFFTVGILGDGYNTSIYEAVASKINANMNIGDNVDLVFSEEFKLERCKSIFFPKFVNFHTQYEPDTISASLNLIPRNMDEINDPSGIQYILSNESHNITNIFRFEN